MRFKFIVSALGIAGFNLFTFFVVVNILLKEWSKLSDVELVNAFTNTFILVTLVCMIATAIFSTIFFQWLMKPVIEMEKRLIKTTEENKKAENIRSEFVANVTHELKTPLTSISGFIETLQDGAAENPEIRTRFIDIIAIETSRLKRLIEDLLVLSEIENKRESSIAKIDVKNALMATVSAMQPIADSKDVKVILTLAEDIYVNGSQDRFSQMMVNLVENAIKYSDDGGNVYITANIEADKICVYIKDQGIGIDDEHIERLFERFYRVDKSRSKKVGGTGLGLSIVKHIAVLFGAELKVESKLGQGSTFVVRFNKAQ